MTAQYSALLSVLYIGLPVRHPLILIFMPILIGSAVAVGWQERGIGVVVELQQRPLGMEENPKTRIDVN
jgi:hypothetical protein